MSSTQHKFCTACVLTFLVKELHNNPYISNAKLFEIHGKLNERIGSDFPLECCQGELNELIPKAMDICLKDELGFFGKFLTSTVDDIVKPKLEKICTTKHYNLAYKRYKHRHYRCKKEKLNKKH